MVEHALELPEEARVETTSESGKGPWALAWKRFRRNRIAMSSLVVFILIVISCVGAPFYAHHIADTNAFQSNINGYTTVHGKKVAVLATNPSGFGTTPLAATWTRHYFLGADAQGRDVMARVLYGGRSSLLIGIGAAVITCFFAILLGIIAGFFGGLTDSLISRSLDVIWAFPVYLLAIALGTALLVQGISVGPIAINPASLWIPTLIIGVVYIPYVARPVRGEVLSVCEQEFVEAAVAQGASTWRLMLSEITPNVITIVIVFLPLMVATNILTEVALSYLGIGVQAPNASWGTLIADGQDLLYTRPLVSIAPGLMILATVLALNVLGDGVRDAIDPRAKLRSEG
jgi:peptide/nickel transport system permease protein